MSNAIYRDEDPALETCWLKVSAVPFHPVLSKGECHDQVIALRAF